MSNTIGFNEANVNVLIANANSKIKEAVASFGEKAQKIMTKLQENWGTTQAQEFGEKYVTGMKEEFEIISTRLMEIPKVIRTTAESQAEDTENVVSISKEEKPDIPTISNTILDKLDNGYVGVYNTLITEVSTAAEEMRSEITNKLTNLSSSLSEEAKNCFQAEAEYFVAEKLGEFTEQARAELEKYIDSVIEQLNESTKNVDRYEKSIQTAGLRN